MMGLIDHRVAWPTCRPDRPTSASSPYAAHGRPAAGPVPGPHRFDRLDISHGH